MFRPVVVACCLAGAGLAGCGAPSPDPAAGSGTTTTTAGPPATASTAPSLGDVPRCETGWLTGSVRPLEPAAGNRYAQLVLTNTGGPLCAMYGYGGLQLVDAQGTPNPTDLVRTPDPGPTLVSLKPGEAAVKKLHWTVVPSGDEPTTGPCQPPSAGAKVIPPDETTALSVNYDFGSVCAGGKIEGSAYFRA
ncbi:MAG TPA: DUF4232 domain-containing protein [Actinophytocola sp.]|uniref:DUF4232 domain-containing protein n=1 Tax=Actinophytocola sp. TaxID=1872138 RepID=UPI002DBA4A26|nr:DUF4232 domain-containing protein [Actinophytocola sp.]HEU5475416.1 DUF4232 domain-containing protein [Actinophytocola sp.]